MIRGMTKYVRVDISLFFVVFPVPVKAKAMVPEAGAFEVPTCFIVVSEVCSS